MSWDDSSAWESLFRITRPGSRTVVCDPSCELVLELARRGYRVLLVHTQDFEVAPLRERLRREGLASQLMGCQAYSAHEPPLLAPDFYELWLFGKADTPLLWEAARASLKKGASVYWFATHHVEPPWGEPIPLPADTLGGVRMPDGEGMNLMGKLMGDD